MLTPTPTDDTTLPRRMADFDTLLDALDYAAQGQRGFNFYSSRGDIEHVLPFSDLRDRALGVARRLTGLGLEPQARVALIADTHPDFLAAFFGAQYAGLLPVPLPLPTSFGGREGYVEQLRGQMQSCRASAALAPAYMSELLDQAVETVDLTFAGSYDDLSALTESTDELARQSANDVCYLQYSSGSTRFPHGVTITQESAMSNCRGNAVHGVCMQEGDRMMSWLPFYHDMGLVGAMLTLVTTQVSVDYLPTEYFARRPMLWVDLMSRNKATITYGPTFGYELIARRATPTRLEGMDLSSVRVAGLGAEMIRAESMREFVQIFGAVGFSEKAFLPSYGMAETTLAVSFSPAGTGLEIDVVDEDLLSSDQVARPPKEGADVKIREIVNCGVPMPEYDLEIRNDNDEVVSDRHIGKIYVRGPSVMTGYYMDPVGTRNVLDDEGWLDTGDMGYMLNGSLYIVGRAKDLIILNGRNHWPQDIEWTVEQR